MPRSLSPRSWRVVVATLAIALVASPDVVPAQAAADSTSPASIVKQLVTQHMAGTMAFDSLAVRAKSRWLSAALQARFATYFAKPVPDDEVPDLDGDPFTDSQDAPTRFTVGAARASGDRRLVPVRFSDGVRRYTVTYVLRRENGAWKVSDIRDRRGTSLLSLLH